MRAESSSLTLHRVGEDAGDAEGPLPGPRLLQVVHGRLAKAGAPPLELRVRRRGPLKRERTRVQDSETQTEGPLFDRVETGSASLCHIFLAI